MEGNGERQYIIIDPDALSTHCLNVSLMAFTMCMDMGVEPTPQAMRDVYCTTMETAVCYDTCPPCVVTFGKWLCAKLAGQV